MTREISNTVQRVARRLPRLAVIGARYYLMLVALQFLLGFVAVIVLASIDIDVGQAADFLNLKR